MNIELTRIAEKKLEQMGATTCGVLVRNEAGSLAAVSEDGRVAWLDDAAMGPVATDGEDALDCALSGQSYTERLIDSVHAELCGMAYDLMLSHTVSGEWPESEADTKAKHDQLVAMAGELRKLKAARAQGGEVEPVADLYEVVHEAVSTMPAPIGEDDGDTQAEHIMNAIKPYTHPPAPTQGVPAGWKGKLEHLLEGFDNLCRNLGKDPYLWGYSNAMRKEVVELLRAPNHPSGEWVALEIDQPREVDVDVKLKDGSIICGCLAQSDGDFYWKGGGSEVFICEHTVAEWRAAQPPKDKQEGSENER